MPLATLRGDPVWVPSEADLRLSTENGSTLDDLSQEWLLTHSMMMAISSMLVEVFLEVDDVDHAGAIRVDLEQTHPWAYNAGNMQIYLQPGNHGIETMAQQMERRVKIADLFAERFREWLEIHLEERPYTGQLPKEIEIEVCPVDGSGHTVANVVGSYEYRINLDQSWGRPKTA